MQDSMCGSLAPVKKLPGVVRRSSASFDDVQDALASKAAWNGSSSGSDLAESDVMLLDEGLESSSLSRWIEELIHEPGGEVLETEGEEFTCSFSGSEAAEAGAGGSVDAVAADLMKEISAEKASSSSSPLLQRVDAAFGRDVEQQQLIPRCSDPPPIFASAHAALSDILKRLTPPTMKAGEFPNAVLDSAEFDVLDAVKSGLGRTRSASSALFSTHVQEAEVSASSRKQIRIGGQHKEVQFNLSSYPPERSLTQSWPVPKGRISGAGALSKLADTSFLVSGSRSGIVCSRSPPRSGKVSFLQADPFMSSRPLDLSSDVSSSIDSMAETIAGPFSSSPFNQQFQFKSGVLDGCGIRSKTKWDSVPSGSDWNPPPFKSSNLSHTDLPDDGEATISELYACDSVDPFQQSGLSKDKAEPQAQNGLRIIQLLLECAEAVSNSQTLLAQGILLQLKKMVSPTGDSMQRVAACFTEALHSRLSNTGYQSYAAIRACDRASSEELLAAYQILYQACPYIKFAHFTSNQAIFEAFDGETRVHILDLDILQGYQWPALMQALAARPEGPPSLRITGVGIPLESVQETGKRLSELADCLHIPFVFHAVGERLEDVKAYMVQCGSGEALAVNSVNRLHRLLGDQRTVSPLVEMLRMVHEQSPKVVTLVEQEAAHNGQAFLSRFLEALHYYSAIFDSLDATLPRASPERAKVEQLIFAREITNIIACEGNERVERHEKFERWRRIMESVGFKGTPMSGKAFDQSRVLLGLYPCDGYTLVEDNGCLLLGWQDRPVIGASAWHC